MKKLFILLSIISAVSCKKEDTSALNCKVSKVITIRSTYVDTTTYTYSGDDMTITTKYSNGAIVYTTKYIKSGSRYNYESYWDAVQKYSGFANINTQGLIDTSNTIYLPTSAFNNRNKSYYDANGYVTRAISNYNSYENDVKYHYTADGNYAYWIYDLYDFSPSPTPTKDSVVFEYYLDKPKVAELYGFESKYGKLNKNLIKKRLYYDLLNSNTLRQTYEYEYLTDSKGLVTRQIWVVKNQPSNIEIRRDTSYYEYICN